MNINYHSRSLTVFRSGRCLGFPVVVETLCFFLSLVTVTREPEGGPVVAITVSATLASGLDGARPVSSPLHQRCMCPAKDPNQDCDSVA